MSEHLPECPCANRRDEFHEHDVATMMNGQLGCLACGVDCICPALRACTVRVLGEVRGVVAAYAESVDAIGGYSWDEAITGSLAAIDRLAQEAP